MNKTVVIIGSLALLGVGAFFYFKTKPKGTDSTGSSSTGSSSTGSSSTGSSSTGSSSTGTETYTNSNSVDTILNTAPIVNPNAPITNAQSAQNTEELAKFNQAQSLVSQIWTLKNKYPSLQGSIPTCRHEFGDNSSDYFKCNQIKNQILEIQNTLKGLGYKEVNGVTTKV